MAKEKIKIYIDPYGNTLNMWWDDPKKSHISEEAEHSFDVIVKDKKGKVIGFEKIGFFPEEINPIKYLREKARFLLESKKRLIKKISLIESL